MPKVGIVMGSDSDMPIMAKAADILDQLGVSYEMTIISAHREPDVFFEYAKSAESKGFKVIIAGAGMAAHLPGMCAAIFPMPVIGIPMHTTSLGGRDSLYSIVQMPSGIPVATVAINGGANAGLLAAKILATSDPELLDRLKAYSQELKEQVEAKDARLQVPRSAICKTTEGMGVWTYQAGKAVFCPIVAGSVENDMVVVMDGLIAGSKVVVAGVQKLYEGAPLEVLHGSE